MCMNIIFEYSNLNIVFRLGYQQAAYAFDKYFGTLPLPCTCKPGEVCMIRAVVPTAWPHQHREPDPGLAFKNTRR